MLSSASIGSSTREPSARCVQAMEAAGPGDRPNDGSTRISLGSSRGVPGAAEAGGGGEGDDPDGGKDEAGAVAAAAERVPAKYNAQSELMATVQNASETIDFDLRS